MYFEYYDSTVIYPPSYFVKLLVMYRPRPVPSVLIYLESSNFPNNLNRQFRFSSLMPIPVSKKVSFSSYLLKKLFIYIEAESLIYPLRVNFTEFLSILIIICFNLYGSVTKISDKLSSNSRLNSTLYRNESYILIKLATSVTSAFRLTS